MDLGQWIAISTLIVSAASVVLSMIFGRQRLSREELRLLREDLAECERDRRSLQRQLLRDTRGALMGTDD